VKKHKLSLRTRALGYLARREYSRAELHAKLSRYSISNNDIDTESDPESKSFDLEVDLSDDLNSLLDDLEARGWLSDERAAKQWLHAKGNRFGAQRIVYELRQKGIPEELIESTLPSLRENELATAREVWQKKFGVLPADHREKAKQMRFLQSRGFSMGTIINLFRQPDLDGTG